MKVLAVVPLVSWAVALLVIVSGEYCHSWRDSRAQWRDGFHCPERMDKKESVLCCGHCDLRYCCGNGRARLDQGACQDHSRGQETPSREHTTELPVHVPFLIVVCVFVVFVLLGSVVAVCFCLSQKSRPPTPAPQSPSPPSEAPEVLPMTANVGTSCGSSSSLYPLNGAPQSHFNLENQQPAPPPSFPQNQASQRPFSLENQQQVPIPSFLQNQASQRHFSLENQQQVPIPSFLQDQASQRHFSLENQQQVPIPSFLQNQASPRHFSVENQQQTPLPSIPQPPNLAFHRTMTLPTMPHPLTFPSTMVAPYRMPKHGARPYRLVPSPGPPNSGTGTIQRSSEIIV